MNGQLFTDDFLLHGIQSTDAWRAFSDAELSALQAGLKEVVKPYSVDSVVNEAMTEAEIIIPILGLLGWKDLVLPQVTASGSRREDVPDLLLLPDAAAKQLAVRERRDDRRYRHGIAILESKRWQRPLDRGDASDLADSGTPSNQILRYLSTVEVASNRTIRWGILTNGRIWRLYFQGARSRSEEFAEFDVAWLAGMTGTQGALDGAETAHSLKVFRSLFGRPSFLPQPTDGQGRTFHVMALAETRMWEAKVSEDLGERVFGEVFPRLANAIATNDPRATYPLSPAYLSRVRDATLIVLYRLLFILYAEDRALLPIADRRYLDYSLRAIRQEVMNNIESGHVFSQRQTRIWDELDRLFAAISVGDPSLGLPAYNGGLFEAERDSIIRRVRIPDFFMAPIIDALSRRTEEGVRHWINYRDLSVQHLGSVYERLLDYLLVERDGTVSAMPQSFARRVTGSYYTHEDLVQLIIESTVGPLIRERQEKFRSLAESFAGNSNPSPSDWSALAQNDPAVAILNLKICDPAMGSGHFLVSLVDYLADQVLETMAMATEVASRRSGTYSSPALSRIATIRSRILAAAANKGWSVDASQLDDRHIIRRMILKRVVHGVDKNPMAVELSKVALWLHTFTVGAPLSFLDHHLRCGDSLQGEQLQAVIDELREIGALLQTSEIQRIQAASGAMEEIAGLTDIDIAEAHRSKDLLAGIDADLEPLKQLLDFWRALRWLIPGWSAKAFKRKSFADSEYAEALVELFSGGYDLIRIMTSGVLISTDLFGGKAHQVKSQAEASELIAEARRIAQRERFLHWEIAFPTVWTNADEGKRGFDATIGNPPWDLLQMQEVEWFAERKPEIARAVRASDRKKLIANLEKSDDQLWNDFVNARSITDTAARVVRESGDFPQLAEGRSNLAKLFVERAGALINSTGIVGLLVPSGIASDRGSSKFFGAVSRSGRLGALFDFENRNNPGGSFFPDVDSRFKFCALIFGGLGRVFEKSACAFYLHLVEDLRDPDRLLTLDRQDFEAVNPNTGGAPIFRTRRDAEITLAMYRSHPILVSRKGGKEKKVWPVRFMQGLFNMTADSAHFKRRDELDAGGWYQVEGNRWKKGDAIALPLYEGKMVQAYDHRAANVVVNEANVHRAAQQEAVSLADHEDPAFFAAPQFWVSQEEVQKQLVCDWVLAFKDVTAPTNVRTMIAAILPYGGYGNTLPLLLPEKSVRTKGEIFEPLLIANLNSIAFDFLARQKVQGQHLNWFIVEQIPVIAAAQFEKEVGRFKLADFVRDEVLRLSFTAWNLISFARQLGYDGPPFPWDETDRRHRLARLDALFFCLYGIQRADAAYILDTFPIVREHDQRQYGRYLTKDLVLAYMNAAAAGDLDSVVSI